MFQPQYIVGLDIGAEQFVAAIGACPWQLLVKGTAFANTPEGIHAFERWLQQHACTPAQTLVCMEATGVYGEVLAASVVAQAYRLASEAPLKVKRAFASSGPKTDAADSQQIAEYACRFLDELTLWQPPSALVEQLSVLLTTREQLVQQSSAQQNALKALQRKHLRIAFAEQVHTRLMAELKSQIKSIEQEIRRLLEQQPPFAQLLTLLLSVPGVGLLLATHLLIMSDLARTPLDPSKLAAHLGICPHERQSGTSVYHRPTSRHYGPSTPRKLFHLAARSVSTHDERFRDYYQRKLAEGKPKALVLNNVANKLVRVVCAVLNTRTLYQATDDSANALTVAT